MNLKKLNWNSFRAKCLTTTFQELPSENLEDNVRLISDLIVEAAKGSSPTFKGHRRRPLVPCWNNDCKEAVKESNRKGAFYRRLRYELSFDEYQRAKGHAQWTNKNAKKECWQKHGASVEVPPASPLSGEPSKD